MKILQLIQQPQLRGAEIFACQLSTELVEKGIQCHIAYLFNGQVDLGEFFPRLKFTSLGGNKKLRFADFRAFRLLGKIIREGGYDIVQANAGDTLKYAVFSKLIFGWGAKIVFRNANQMSMFMSSRWHLALNTFLLKRVFYVISVSENCRGDIVKLLPSLLSKSTTIPIGTYEYASEQPTHKSDEGPVILNIGSFVPEKNQQALLKSFALVTKEYPTARLWLVGDGAGRLALEQLAGALGISTRVIFWGFRKDVISILKSVDVLVMPSLIEGLPGVILEAFACRVPVVAAHVGGIPEVVENGVTGICIEDGSEAVYADSIVKILRDPEFTKKITEKAHRKLKEQYMMDQISNRFANVYKQLVEVR